MKKSLVITLFLVLSSFFFISIKEVKAYEINIENLDMINEEFFKLKEVSEEYISSSSEYDNFIIAKDGNKLYSYIFKYNNSYSCSVNTNFLLRVNNYYKITVLYNGELYFNGGGNSLMVRTLPYYSSLNFNLDSNSTLTLKFEDRYFEINSGEKLLTYYDVYKDNQYFKDPHLGEKEVIANFYTICIDKLGYLGEQIVGNYVYLSMIVVLILVFIIELIRRWLM